MTTMRVSWHLDFLSAKLALVALRGETIGPELLRDVAAILRMCSVDAEQMELRLAGVEVFPDGDNVISLKPHLLKKRYVIRRVVEEDRPL